MKKLLREMTFNTVETARTYVIMNYDFNPIRIF